jgi:hypothetical protein
MTTSVTTTAEAVGLALTISSIQLANFTGDGSAPQGGFPPINNYNGIPLYCHVADTGTGNFALVVDNNGPSTFIQRSGTIQSVTVVTAPGMQTMTMAQTGLQYNGVPIDTHLQVNDDGSATIVLQQRTAAVSGGRFGEDDFAGLDTNVATITTVTVAKSKNGTANDLIFFTNIPLPSAQVAEGDTWTATISWADAQGGAMGPIGGATTP